MALNSADLPARDITCREVAEWTSAYLDAHQDDLHKVRMALHLAVCAGCRAYVHQIASVRDTLGRLPGPTVDPVRRDRLRQAFSLQRSKPSSTP
ncbi:MAG: anti-sigma factor [Nitrospira sp. CR2.1]|nr:anti-sigma factor [Nitrospira sp. CR2.1]